MHLGGAEILEVNFMWMIIVAKEVERGVTNLDMIPPYPVDWDRGTNTYHSNFQWLLLMYMSNMDMMKRCQMKNNWVSGWCTQMKFCGL